MVPGWNSMISPNRDHEVMLWGSCGGKWWMHGCGAEHHGKALWGSASTWKMSSGSKRSLQLSLPAALPPYDESESACSWGYTVRQDPIWMSHDNKNVVEPNLASYIINRNCQLRCLRSRI